jgi:hypothetical protein
VREQQEVGTEDAGDRAQGSQIGHAGASTEHQLRKRGGQAAHQVEDEKRGMAESILEVVAEDPQGV